MFKVITTVNTVVENGDVYFEDTKEIMLKIEISKTKKRLKIDKIPSYID